MSTTLIRLKQHHTIKLADFIRAVCVRDKLGRAIYREGWDDARVQTEFAAQIGGPVSMSSIRSVRVESVGPLHDTRGRPKGNALADRVARLEQWAANPAEPFALPSAATAGPLFGSNGVPRK